MKDRLKVLALSGCPCVEVGMHAYTHTQTDKFANARSLFFLGKTGVDLVIAKQQYHHATPVYNTL